MRKMSAGSESLTVCSLCELDALVGQVVMSETPMVRWADSEARFHFDSLEDALDLFDDPVLLGFVAEKADVPTILREVCEFRPYSTLLPAAWDVVDRLGTEPLQLRREGHDWFAAFGRYAELRGESAAQAICLAALRARGCEVSLQLAADQ